MSKRKAKPFVSQPLHQTGGDLRRVGVAASQQVYEIRVSLPVLRVCQLLVDDLQFRKAVIKMAEKKIDKK